jgi:hypothetical protein
VRAARHRHPIDASEAPSLVVVDRAGELVRVVAEEGGLRLLLWVDSADLFSVTTASTTLGLEPDERRTGDDIGRVQLRAGVPLRVQEENGEVARVAFSDACLTAEGWMRRERLGREFIPVDDVDQAARDRSVRGGTDVFDRPGGVVIARFHSDCDVLGGGGEQDGMTPILYAGPGALVRGWVGVAAPSASGGAMGGLYGGLMGSFRSSERFHLAAGACLYGQRAGEVIGVVTEDVDQPSAKEEGNGWWRLTIETEWGVLQIWVVDDGPPSQEEEVDENWGIPHRTLHRTLKACR